MKKINKKSDLKKIAKSLGIAIPASLLFATNANAIQTSTATINKSMQIVENSISSQNKNEVMNHIVGEIILSVDIPRTNQSHTNSHANAWSGGGSGIGTHTNTHANAN